MPQLAEQRSSYIDQPPVNIVEVDPYDHITQEQPLAERADQLMSDEFSRARARRFIAEVAMDDVYIDPCSEEAPNTSLLESLRRANAGDREAKESVRINAHIAVVEAMIKSGHISQVSMTINEQGNWLQFGQAMLHVHANALRTATTRQYDGVRKRTEAETINGQRIEDLGRAGTLQDHYFFVPSLLPSEEELPFDIATKEAGFFGDTMTAAFQLTTIEDEEGVIESAFVAGVNENSGLRYDIEIMRQIYNLAGYDASGWQPLDFLQTPLIIHKSNLPNGIADIVQLYDELVEESLGSRVFFGQDATLQDQLYGAFGQRCQERELLLQGVTDKVVDKLLAHANQLLTPDSAIEKLSELVGPLGVEYAISDDSIDPFVFGTKAASFIEQARVYQRLGDDHMMQQAIENAVNSAVVTMCGMTSSKSLDGIVDGSETKKSSDEEDCEFISKSCPVCGTKNVKTKVTKNKITGSCGCEVRK
jgi:hypothetical protein